MVRTPPRPRRPTRRFARRRWLVRSALVGLALLVGLTGLVGVPLALLPDAGPLRETNPLMWSLREARRAEALEAGRKLRERHEWVALGKIAPRAVDAVLASEDARFYEHDGIDREELRIALEEAARERALGRGASTITQQLAKNLWLSTDRSLVRKAKELLLARALEKELGKERILTLYLNVAEWGDGVYGIEAAARTHFGVRARELTVAQGAMLAAMLPAPRRWGPHARSPRYRRRALRIVDELAAAGRIDADAATDARAELEHTLR